MPRFHITQKKNYLRLLSDFVALSFVKPIVIRKWRLIVNTYFQTLLLEENAKYKSSNLFHEQKIC